MGPLLTSLLTTAIPGWRALGRRSWCSKQRSRLRGLDPKIVWLHDGEKIPWVFWGAENGFFELEWAGRLPYLRATPAAG
jgi:hypothetical protein